MNRCKSLSAFLFAVFLIAAGNANSFAQRRDRVIPNRQQPQEINTAHNQPKAEPKDLQEDLQPRPRPALTNKIVVSPNYQPLVKKTVSSQPTANPAIAANNNSASRYAYSAMFSVRLVNAIQTRMGKPYVYGSSGPSSYDCSGLVWSVFGEAGFSFERTSARSIWQMSEPVAEGEQYKMGTLIFFKNLGHIGIVADANGFYHASSSHGVTYSRFDGYWKDKIVGFRRLRIENQIAQIK
jgi:cell wall-associated NlpC family hydrolase